MNVKHELQDIISGVGDYAEKDLIKAAAHYLRQSQKTSGASQKPELTKEQEAAELINWINHKNLWFNEHEESRFIARGAEQKVYLHHDERYVYKLNDSVFYRYWLDYFYSLLVHNYFFPATSYELIGFFKAERLLFAVVKQPFIEITEETNINSIRNFLNENGFKLKRNNDYFNPGLSLILEDLHDENVLTNNGVLFSLTLSFI